jgi:hypothetical protein
MRGEAAGPNPKKLSHQGEDWANEMLGGVHIRVVKTSTGWATPTLRSWEVGINRRVRVGTPLGKTKNCATRA